MSGQSAIRGFTYQTIVSVVKSLTDANWDYVNVEPDSVNDKVDILWERKDGEVNCQQVKSSINNFTKNDIVTWLENMIIDVPNSNLYELILIGNVSTGTDTFINDINSRKAANLKSAVIKSHLAKIKIDLIVFQLDFLESKVRDEVSRFLSAAGYHLPHATIALIAGGLIYQFFQFSVLGTKVSQSSFSDYLLKWVKFNYAKDISIELKKSKLSVFFYVKESRSFVEEIKLKQVEHNSQEIMEKFVSNAWSQYLIAERIKLTKRISDYNNDKVVFSFPVFPGFSDASIPNHQKELIKNDLHEIFGVSVSEEFFSIGNLKENTQGIISPFSCGKTFSGTEDEKSKRQAIVNLYWELRTIKELKLLHNFLSGYNAICLVVENSGSAFDEEVCINLKFPKGVKILTQEDFFIPNDIDAIEILIEYDFISKLFRIQEDSLITRYDYGPFVDLALFEQLDFAYKFHNEQKRLQNKKDKLLRQIETFMDFEVYDDLKDFSQLRFNFKQVNPNMKVAFPCLVLFNTDMSFDFEYSITSKHSSFTHSGKLSCIF